MHAISWTPGSTCSTLFLIPFFLLFSTAYNTSLIYCFVIWCLHTNKRRPCSSTLSGHPSSSNVFYLVVLSQNKVWQFAPGHEDKRRITVITVDSRRCSLDPSVGNPGGHKPSIWGWFKVYSTHKMVMIWGWFHDSWHCVCHISSYTWV